MRNICLGLLFFLHTTALFALASSDFPAEFQLKQTPCTEGKYCIVMLQKDKRLGLLQQSPNYGNLFYFFDESQHVQLSIKMLKTQVHQEPCSINYCPIFYDFEMYEKNNHLVAKLELSYDVMKSSYDGFKLYTKDRRHILIKGAHTTATGTQSHLYDGIEPEHKLVLISRPMFTLSLDSTISILDKPRLRFTIEPNILAAGLALYCNTELFHANLHPPEDNVISPATLSMLRQKLQNVAENQGLISDMHEHLSDRAIKAAGKDLSARYQQVYGDFWSHDSLFDKDQKIQQLFDLGIDMILSHSLSLEEEKALLQFLIDQLYINQPE